MKDTNLQHAYSVLIAYAVYKTDSNILLENSQLENNEIRNDFNNIQPITQKDIKLVT